MKNALNLKVFAALAFVGAGMLLTGCKPDLTQANALAMIQAKYDQTPAVGVTITVDKNGLQQGLAAKYWTLTKVYPNLRWADYTLTAEGKKAITLLNGGDMIQWHPDSGTDSQFVVVTTAANHLKARDIQDIQDAVGGGKTVDFTEAVNLDGVPDVLQNIAHSAGNKLSNKRQADFAYEGSAWKLHSIE